MARRILHLEGDQKQGNLTNNVTYQISNGWVTVYKDGEVLFKRKLNRDRAYVLWCTSAGKVRFEKMRPPTQKLNLISWLCGVAKEAYVLSEEEYERMILDYYDRFSAQDIDHAWNLMGPHYKMYWTQKRGAQPYSVACYIEENITLEEIVGLIPTMLKAGFGKRYLKKILNERFYIPYHVSGTVMNKHN